MKKYLFFFSTVSILLIMPTNYAKADDNESVKTLLFPQFEKGIVLLKDRTKLTAQLNYDLIDEKMLFLESDSILYELDPKVVITVLIGEQSFVPVKNKYFYERIETGNNEFYICHKTKVLSKGKAAGYGTYSETMAISGFAISTNYGKTFLLSPELALSGIDESNVYINNGKNFEKINSMKSLLKFFKSHQAAIDAYSKENKTKFNKMEDVVAIVKFAFSL